MKKVTDEEAQRALSTWCDFDGGLCTSMGAALEEFIANREKEEASEPAAPTITISHGAMTGCTQYAIDQASESKVCEYCGPKCYGGAAHNERVENGDRYTDAPKSTAITEQECKHSHIVRWQKDGEWVCICRHCGWMAYQSITSKSNPR